MCREHFILQSNRFPPAAALDSLQKEAERSRVFPGHKEVVFPAKILRMHEYIYHVIQSTALGSSRVDALLVGKMARQPSETVHQ